MHQHILLRLQWGRGGQVPSVLKHQCGPDGQHGAGEQTSKHDACFQLDPVQHRGVWALSGVQEVSEAHKLAWTSLLDIGVGDRRWSGSGDDVEC